MRVNHYIQLLETIIYNARGPLHSMVYTIVFNAVEPLHSMFPEPLHVMDTGPLHVMDNEPLHVMDTDPLHVMDTVNHKHYIVMIDVMGVFPITCNDFFGLVNVSSKSL